MGKFRSPAPGKTRLWSIPALGSSSGSLVKMPTTFILQCLDVTVYVISEVRHWLAWILEGEC